MTGQGPARSPNAIDVIECAVCSAPAEEVDQFTLGGTAIADMRTIRCVNDHRYNVVAAFVDEEPTQCWAHSIFCACSIPTWAGMTHRSCSRTATTSLGLCERHALEITGT